MAILSFNNVISYGALTTSWINQTGENNATILNALNGFEIELTAIGLSKFYYLYPFVGGTSIKNSYNFINTAIYQITWGGGVTHNSNGYQGNGSTGYGDTGFNPTTASVVKSDFGVTTYSRTSSISGNQCDTGVSNGPSQILLVDLGQTRAPASFHTSGFNFLDAGTRVGMQTIIRDGASSQIFYKDGVATNTNSSSATSDINLNIFIAARNSSGSPSLYSSKNIALQVSHKALSPADMVSLNTANTNFQTALNRFL